MPVAGPRVSPRHFVQRLTLKVAVDDAQTVTGNPGRALRAVSLTMFWVE